MTPTASPSPTFFVTGRLSWGAIFAGTFIAIGMWLLLDALGMALGLTAIDTGDPRSARTAGMITGIWSVIIPLIALFIGAAVAARSCGATDRMERAIHGAVLWALTTVVGAFAIGAVLTLLVGGAAAVGGKAMQATASVASQAIQGSQSGGMGTESPFAALGIQPDDLLEPANKRLREQGRPEVTARQLEDAAQDVVRRGVREGRLDREALISALADHTALTRDDANALADQLQRQIDQRAAQARSELERAQQQAQEAALKTANATGKAMWGVFAVLLLGFGASLLGASVVRPRATERRSDAERPSDSAR